jgi:hypothetical protein
MTAKSVTPAAAYLKATATNQKSDIVRPDAADRDVFQRAFTAIVRRRFQDTSPVAEITRSVANSGQRHPYTMVPLLEAEMLVREALGETVPTGEISPPVVVATHVLMFASLAEEMALTDAELDALIEDAARRISPPDAPGPE